MEKIMIELSKEDYKFLLDIACIIKMDISEIASMCIKKDIQKAKDAAKCIFVRSVDETKN